jgi:hypothetical protein
MRTDPTFQKLAEDAGIHFPNAMSFLPEGTSHNFNLACDAQPTLLSTTNAGIPAFLANVIDPKVIEVMVAPMKAAVILGEEKKGDWTTKTYQFIMIENAGEVSSYGDYNQNGTVDVNTNFVSRESYHYQTFTKWGELELEMAALAKLDLASRKNISSVLILNKYQNQTYFLGVSGLKLYGLLNDPNLLPPISPLYQWSLDATDGAKIYEDIRRLFRQLQTQANGLVDNSMAMTLALSPTAQVNLLKTNTFNVSVEDQIKKNFPGITVETAPEYSTAAGELVQLIVKELDGQQTATTAFTEKMRAHAIVRGTSDFLQKKSQGTWGTVIFRPFLISSMVGI